MRPWLALATLWLALPARADEARPPPAAAVSEVTGAVAAVDLQRRLLTIGAAGGPATVAWDRNTLIYQPGGATTAAAIRPGWFVKAGVDAARTAYWIQVRPSAPPSSPAPAATPAATPPSAPGSTPATSPSATPAPTPGATLPPTPGVAPGATPAPATPAPAPAATQGGPAPPGR